MIAREAEGQTELDPLISRPTDRRASAFRRWEPDHHITADRKRSQGDLQRSWYTPRFRERE